MEQSMENGGLTVLSACQTIKSKDYKMLSRKNRAVEKH
jgi:hypothetical protein